MAKLKESDHRILVPGASKVMPDFLLATSPCGTGSKGCKGGCMILLCMAVWWAEHRTKQTFGLTQHGCSYVQLHKQLSQDMEER